VKVDLSSPPFAAIPSSLHLHPAIREYKDLDTLTVPAVPVYVPATSFHSLVDFPTVTWSSSSAGQAGAHQTIAGYDFVRL